MIREAIPPFLFFYYSSTSINILDSIFYCRKYERNDLVVEYLSKAEKLREKLGMDSYPVGIKFLQDNKKADNYLSNKIDKKNNYRYCQALMKARYGNRVMLNKNNIACPVSAAAFGFKPLAEKLQS